MVILNVHVSNFHLHSTTPFPASTPISLRLWSTTRRICGVESPPAQPQPQPPARRALDLAFPPAWAVSWTERLPDRLAQRAAALHVAAVATPKPKLRAVCAPRRPHRLGALRIDLFHLATATVCRTHSLTAPDGAPTNYTLSFDIVVEEVATVALDFARIRIATALPHRRPLPLYTLAVEHVGAPTVRAVCARADHHHHHHPSSRISTSSSSPAPSDTEPDTASDEGHTDLPTTADLTCSSLPSLQLRSSSLYQLAHSTLRIRLTADSLVHHANLPLHQIWSAIAYPTHPIRIRLQLSDHIILHASITCDTPPPTGQMAGGVTTDRGVTGAHPVIFGACLPDLTQMPETTDLPHGWIRLVDTFGYRYFRNWRNAVDVWTPPPDESISEALRQDEIRALENGYDRGKYSVFISKDSGEETWIHPAATRLSFPSYSAPVPEEDDHHPPRQSLEVDTFNSLSTFDMSELHPAAFTQVPNSHHPHYHNKDSRKPSSSDDEDAPRGRIVEMAWHQMPARRYAPGPAVEGYTLTTVNKGKTVLKFGGSTGSGARRINSLHSYDVETTKWHQIEASGVAPAPRTGHGAVALGPHQSRLLIFGGSSPQGRRNDLHMFHVANKTWSPVSYTGTAPEVRARMGMTVTSDGSTALVFGGRSLYRYLGGRNYDPVFVNAFHAERSEWVRMRPQGSGPRPSPRSGCVVEFVRGRHMLVHGGYDDGRDRYFDDTYLFDMVSCSWQKMDATPPADIPQAREGHMSAMLGDHVVVYGGDSKSGLLSDVRLFDAHNMRWNPAASLVGHGPGRMCGGGMASTGADRLLVVGGDSGFQMSRAAFELRVSRRSAINAEEMAELGRERGADADRCVVCLDAPTDTMFLWCGHSVCCRLCAKRVRGVCPVCRQPFSKIVRGGFDAAQVAKEEAVVC